MKMQSEIVSVLLSKIAPPLPYDWHEVKLDVWMVDSIFEQIAPPIPPLYVWQLVKKHSVTVKDLPAYTYIPPPLEDAMAAVLPENVTFVKEMSADVEYWYKIWDEEVQLDCTGVESALPVTQAALCT